MALAIELLLAASPLALPLKLTLVVLLITSGLLLRQLNRWERLLLQGDGHAPRNR